MHVYNVLFILLKMSGLVAVVYPEPAELRKWAGMYDCDK
jgi:hypothetical protein